MVHGRGLPNGFRAENPSATACASATTGGRQQVQHGNYLPQHACQAAIFIESVADLRHARC